MKLSLPFSLALIASISPAMARGPASEVTINDDAGENTYAPPTFACEDTDDPEAKVTSIKVQAMTVKSPKCTFYTEPGCDGDKWIIKVPEDSQDGIKTQKFSKPFYVASFRCTPPPQNFR
ncbi:uncharacterized protein N7529_000236 [Penicillium soppii]|uniref:uncharacterized protein n=1 Tax=Penicillium soppii TaxID=69789 RepID=UPI002548BE95|nr:uncharacterized protein N7529_000236 [Penicillium soppii]KAJ5881564.1 hypothetical protein N7529_000236 [Penicillium soppii]